MIADNLAKAATSNDLVDIDIETNDPATKSKEIILKWEKEKAMKDWVKGLGQKTRKRFIKGFSCERSEKILRFNRRDLRVLTGLLTGHACLNSHLYKIGKAEDETCRLCLDDDESTTHLLMDCPATEWYRKEFLIGKVNEWNPYEIIKFAKRTEIYDSFFPNERD